MCKTNTYPVLVGNSFPSSSTNLQEYMPVMKTENGFSLKYFSKINHVIPWEDLKNVQWKNKRACGKEAYCPTKVEHIANVITHGVWVIPSIFGWKLLLQRAKTSSQVLAALVYGASLVALFSVSTCFHSVFYCNRNKPLKDALHRCDRAMIYIFIAGSYFPWLTIVLNGHTGLTAIMQWFVWLLAFLGIIYQQLFHERFKSLETIFYLIMGIGPALPIISENDFSGMRELKIGGMIYVLGVIFFKADGSIPCAHAIWHIFVVVAAGVHYFAILSHLFPET